MIRIESYVPVLKARAGEALAIAALPPEIRHAMTPLFEVCPPEYDFETESLPESIDDHMAKVARRILGKWGFAACLVDLMHFPAQLRMDDGRHPVAWLLGHLRENGVRAVPVTGPGRDPEHDTAATREGAIGGFGLGLRLSLDVCPYKSLPFPISGKRRVRKREKRLFRCARLANPKSPRRDTVTPDPPKPQGATGSPALSRAVPTAPRPMSQTNKEQ